MFPLTPKGRLSWDPTGKVGSSPLTPIPFNCQQSPPINPPHPLPSPDTLLRAPGAAGGSQPCQEPGSAGPTEAGGRSSRQDAPPRVGCRGGSPHHPDPSSPQPGDFTHPVPQERARPRGPVSFQRQRRVEEKKKKKGKQREQAGATTLPAPNPGPRPASTSFPAG